MIHFPYTEISMRLFADYACLSYQQSDPEFLIILLIKNCLKFMKLLANSFFINCSIIKFLLFNKTAKICEFSLRLMV